MDYSYTPGYVVPFYLLLWVIFLPEKLKKKHALVDVFLSYFA